MANPLLFSSRGSVPVADAKNHHGAPAYGLSDRAALAQLALTGCLNGTFYATPQDQLTQVLDLCRRLPATYIGQTAVLARQQGHMKDLPALLLAVLAARPTEHDRAVLDRVWDLVIDNGKMLRNFVQIVRSGVTGRRSLGSRPKRLVRRWLATRTADELLRASVGANPSLADVIKMVHPKPETAAERATFGYLVGRPYDIGLLPAPLADYEVWKAQALAGNVAEAAVPRVPFQKLTSLPLPTSVWTRIAQDAGWQMTRMNLRTFARHGVFEDPALVDLIARRLRNPQAIRRARVFPYQLLQAWRMAGDLPEPIREALHDALELAVANVPPLTGRVAICPDVSGSMASPVTGWRPGATTAVRCIDVAGLLAATFLRQTRDALVLPFEHRVVDVRLERRDTVMTNAEKLASIGGGGTACSAPLKRLAQRNERVDLVVLVSDNESWCDVKRPWGSSGTETMAAWAKVKKRNPRAKLVCIDIQPYPTTQAKSRADVLNVGGFSDAVFGTIAAFLDGRHTGEHLVARIEEVVLPE